MPDYSVAPVIGRELGLAALGTFHLRQGDQALLINRDPVSGAWGRIFAEKREQASSQVVSGTTFDLKPNYDGDLYGLQVGLDLVSHAEDDGDQWRLGVSYSRLDSRGDIQANTRARIQAESGQLHVEADYVGANLTYVDADGWYVDSVAMYGWLDMSAISIRSIGARMEGNAALASVEVGGRKRLGRSGAWRLEPMAQLIWQRTSMDDTGDLYSAVRFDDQRSWTSRLGVRLEGDKKIKSAFVQPYVDINWLHHFEATHDVWFNDRALVLEDKADILKVGTGFAAQLAPKLSSYFTLEWGTDLDGQRYRSLGGTFGVRVLW